MTRPNVLVVEDEAALLTLLRYNLEKEGFAVAEARDGEEALLHLKEQMPDAVLLDWMLPRISGLELCRQIRRSPAWREVPVIMLTARGEEADRVRGLDSGADDYVVKPFSTSELVARLQGRHPPRAPGGERRSAAPRRSGARPCRAPRQPRRPARSISGRPSSACCASSSSGRAGCSRASSSSTGSGAAMPRSSCGPSTSISAACARRSTRAATRTSSAPSAPPAMPSTGRRCGLVVRFQHSHPVAAGILRMLELKDH